ncbi:hypothetical protein LTR85_005029 [Meristemomyces frigidus]|nr:hypothetical protein LTR85_005029 [Meristemomyces frigidus]
MLRKLFGSPKKAKPDDIESCPSTPIDEVPPLCLTPGYRSPSTASSPAPALSPTTEVRIHRKRPSLWRSSDLDTVIVIADEQSQALFDVPRRYISALLDTQEPETVVVHERDTETAKSVTGILLRRADLVSFYDFVQWTKNGRILQYPHDNVEWLMEHHARRFINALALGIIIKSTEYQCAAVSELHSLGSLLTWPEDLVNGIFAATSAFSLDEHPARHLIVAIVAAKTCGSGKRRVRQGARDRNVERGDRISSTTFWKIVGPSVNIPKKDGSNGKVQYAHTIGMIFHIAADNEAHLKAVQSMPK